MIKIKLLIIGAGVTLHEALKAYDICLEQGIYVAVIDLYSIKPLDAKTILKVAASAGKKIITVEDHYIQGGLGQEVTYAIRDTDVLLNVGGYEFLVRENLKNCSMGRN